MGTILFRRGKALAFLSVVFAVLFLCLAPDCSIGKDTPGGTGQKSANAGSLGEIYEFRLPVSLPENRTSGSLVLTRAKDRPLVYEDRLADVLLGRCVMLFGGLVLWRYFLRQPIRKTSGHTPVISMRIGGHAPPAAVSG